MRVDLNMDSPQSPTSKADPSSPEGMKDQFLKLLVAQLKNQDPLKPQDGTEYVAQLATLTQVEQATEVNLNLKALIAGQGASARTGMIGIVGKNLVATADRIQLDPRPGSTLNLSAHLESPATKVQVVIRDAAGNPVRTIDVAGGAAGDVPIAWNGTDENGQPLPAGPYKVEVKATAADGHAVGASARIRGLAEGLDFNPDGTTEFRVGSARVTPTDIVSVQN